MDAIIGYQAIAYMLAFGTIFSWSNSIAGVVHYTPSCSYGTTCSFIGNLTVCNMTVDGITFPIEMENASAVTLYSCKQSSPNVKCWYAHSPYSFGSTVGNEMFLAQCKLDGNGLWTATCIVTSVSIALTLAITIPALVAKYKAKTSTSPIDP